MQFLVYKQKLGVFVNTLKCVAYKYRTYLIIYNKKSKMGLFGTLLFA